MKSLYAFFFIFITICLFSCKTLPSDYPSELPKDFSRGKNIVSHRGYNELYPENTMLAFQKAYETVIYEIGIDVHLTKDGVPVVLHDRTVDRTTDGKGQVSDLTLNEIKKLTIKNKQDPKNPEHIPTLEEYCKWASDKDLITSIEIKTDNKYYEDIEKLLYSIVKKYNLERKVIFASFNPFSIMAIKKIDPNVQTEFLIHKPVKNMESLIAFLGIEWYSINYKYCTQEFVDNCHKNGILVDVWTLDSKADFYRLANMNVDTITTDKLFY